MLKVGDQVNIDITIQGKRVIGLWVSEVEKIEAGSASLKIPLVNGSASMSVAVSTIKPSDVLGQWVTVAQLSFPSA